MKLLQFWRESALGSVRLYRRWLGPVAMALGHDPTDTRLVTFV